METRMERYRRIKKEKRIKKLKYIIVISCLGILVVGLNIVYQTARELDCLVNSNIFSYDFNNNILELFGESYFIDFKRIKGYF